MTGCIGLRIVCDPGNEAESDYCMLYTGHCSWRLAVGAIRSRSQDATRNSRMLWPIV